MSRTSIRKPLIWIEYYFSIFGMHYLTASICGALLLYLVGFIISLPIGFSNIYVSTIPVYLAIIGMAWGSTCTGWSIKKIQIILTDIRPAFAVEDQEFSKISKYWISMLFNNRLYLIGSGFLIICAWVYFAIFMSLGRLPWVPYAWSHPPYLFFKNLIIDILLIPCLMLLFSTGAGIVIYNRIVFSVNKFPLVPVPEFIREILRPITDFGVSTAIAWSSGICLVVVFVRPAFNIPSSILICFLTSLGFLMLLGPHYAIHNALERMKHKLMEQTYDKLTSNCQPTNLTEAGVLRLW